MLGTERSAGKMPAYDNLAGKVGADGFIHKSGMADYPSRYLRTHFDC